jgi:hypothetical protein
MHVLEEYLAKIMDTPKHACFSCGRLWFRCQVSYASISLIQSLPIAYQGPALQEPILISNSCRRTYLQGKSWDTSLREHIMNNIPNMNVVSSLNKIEEPLVSPRLAFAQIYQLKGYGQYGIRGSIVNVPANLDLIQNVLPRLPHDSSIIVVYLKRKLEYKSIYMSGFVRPNIVMKALFDLCKTPLYENANISIKEDWKDVMDSLINDDNILNKKDETTLNEPISFDGFEEVKDIEGTDTLIQNILEPENIIDDDSIAIAPGENF